MSESQINIVDSVIDPVLGELSAVINIVDSVIDPVLGELSAVKRVKFLFI